VRKVHLTPKGYTRTGVWSLIDDWLDKLLSIERRKERAEARKREEIAAKERIRRENAMSMNIDKRPTRSMKMSVKTDKSSAAFDRKMIERRGR
jgi:hypothetical protein